MPLPPRPGRVPVVLQHLSAERAALGDLAGVAVPVIGQLGDLPVADPVMVAPGQQRRPGRRAHRRRVEAVEPDPLAVDPRQRRRCATSPPNVAGSPGPASSISTIRMFGASSGSRRGSTRSHTTTPASSARRDSPTASAETEARPEPEGRHDHQFRLCARHQCRCPCSHSPSPISRSARTFAGHARPVSGATDHPRKTLSLRQSAKKPRDRPVAKPARTDSPLVQARTRNSRAAPASLPMGLRPHLGGNNTVQDITYASGSTRRLRTPGLRVPSFRRAPRGSRVNTTGWATVTPVCPERSFPCKPRRSVGTDTAPSTKQGQSDGRGIAGKLHRQNAGALRMNATCEFAQMRARARLDSARLVLSSRRRGTGRLQGRPGDHATGRGLAIGLPRTHRRHNRTVLDLAESSCLTGSARIDTMEDPLAGSRT